MLSVKPWRFEAVMQFYIAIFISFGLGITVNELLRTAGVSAFREPDDAGAVLLATMSFQGVAWLFIWNFLRQHQIGWREAFGIRGPGLKRALPLAVLVTVASLPVAWCLQIASVYVLKRIGSPPAEQAAVTLLAGAKLGWLRVYLAVFTVVIVPVAEEFVFRGMLYPFVKQLGYPRLAWIGVNLVFALIHLDAAVFVPLFVLGLAFTWLYERTDNLLAPVAAHALFNAVNLVALYGYAK